MQHWDPDTLKAVIGTAGTAFGTIGLVIRLWRQSKGSEAQMRLSWDKTQLAVAAGLRDDYVRLQKQCESHCAGEANWQAAARGMDDLANNYRLLIVGLITSGKLQMEIPPPLPRLESFFSGQPA